jgi:hypothetical protein
MHIYHEPSQPATSFKDYNFDPPMEFTAPGNRLYWTHCCYRRRPAKNSVLQVYYDLINIFCAPGKGCKSSKEIKAKRKREFTNRSRAQKARWAKLKGVTR